jgi:hypothetical protein
MFTAITNYKKMFSSFIKNEFGANHKPNPTPVTVQNFIDSNGVKDSDYLLKMFDNKSLSGREMKVINDSTDKGEIT